jgi:hypothetical protein
MARNEVADALNMQGQNIIATVQGEGPVEDLEKTFVENIHAANRAAKKMLKRKVTEKLRGGGVRGEGYDQNYAKRKRRSTGRLYGTSGPVDFRYSGRLWNELVGRGRAKPSEPSLTFWLGLKHPNRRRPESAPGGGGITYRQLVRKLRRQKPGRDGNPFGPTDEGREEIAETIGDRLMGITRGGS